MQQAGVNAIALGEHFIQLHRAEHGTNIGHRQIDDRQLKIADFIGGFWCIDHLNEADGVNSDVGVIARDDFLRRDIQHLLHHVHFAADAVHKRHH